MKHDVLGKIIYVYVCLSGSCWSIFFSDFQYVLRN